MVKWFMAGAVLANAFCAGIAIERGLMLDAATFVASGIVWGFGAFTLFRIEK